MKPLELILRVQLAAGLSQKELGDVIGASERTVSRIYAGQSPLYKSYWADLAAVVLPHDASLAAMCARMGGHTLEELGLVKPAPPPEAPKAGPEPPKPAPKTAHLVDSVLYAAALAVEATPQAIRPAVSAAFQRAAEMGMGVETIAAELRDASRPRATKARPAAR